MFIAQGVTIIHTFLLATQNELSTSVIIISHVKHHLTKF